MRREKEKKHSASCIALRWSVVVCNIALAILASSFISPPVTWQCIKAYTSIASTDISSGGCFQLVRPCRAFETSDRETRERCRGSFRARRNVMIPTMSFERSINGDWRKTTRRCYSNVHLLTRVFYRREAFFTFRLAYVRIVNAKRKIKRDRGMWRGWEKIDRESLPAYIDIWSPESNITIE